MSPIIPVSGSCTRLRTTPGSSLILKHRVSSFWGTWMRKWGSVSTGDIAWSLLDWAGAGQEQGGGVPRALPGTHRQSLGLATAGCWSWVESGKAARPIARMLAGNEWELGGWHPTSLGPLPPFPRPLHPGGQPEATGAVTPSPRCLLVCWPLVCFLPWAPDGVAGIRGGQAGPEGSSEEPRKRQ